jgi:hypothetical protein
MLRPISDLAIEVAKWCRHRRRDNLSIAPGEVLGLVESRGPARPPSASPASAAPPWREAGIREISIGDAAMLSLGDVALRHARGSW